VNSEAVPSTISQPAAVTAPSWSATASRLFHQDASTSWLLLFLLLSLLLLLLLLEKPQPAVRPQPPPDVFLFSGMGS
jgi:hypothetical protein